MPSFVGLLNSKGGTKWMTNTGPECECDSSVFFLPKNSLGSKKLKLFGESFLVN